jgi:hypothetical protein
MWRAELAAAWHLLAGFAWVTAWLIFWQRKRHCNRDKKRDASAMKCHLGMIHARQKIHYAGQVGMVCLLLFVVGYRARVTRLVAGAIAACGCGVACIITLTTGRGVAVWSGCAVAIPIVDAIANKPLPNSFGDIIG